VTLVQVLSCIARARAQRTSDVWCTACDYAAREVILCHPDNHQRTELLHKYQELTRGKREPVAAA